MSGRTCACSRIMRFLAVSKLFASWRSFFCTVVLCGIFPMCGSWRSIYSLPSLETAQSFTRKRKRSPSGKGIGQNSSTDSFRALHNRAQTRGQEWGIMRVAKIRQLRTQEVVSPPLKYRDLFEVPLNIKWKYQLEETGRLYFNILIVTRITVINSILRMIQKCVAWQN